ncbi:MAG: hypothetical protein AB2747_05440 [Candidatus Thiodiazotropha taylori]
MGIPTIFRSDDVGAPTLNGLAGTLNNVLRACLVDGYGSKTALGWALEFEDVPQEVSVFRAATGERQYLRIQHNTASGGGSTTRVAMADVYETMSDENTGTGNWHGGFVPVSNALTADARAWALIGDEEGFYLWIRNNNGTIAYDANYARLHWFGDIIPADALDTNVCALGVSPVADHGTSDQPRMFQDVTMADSWKSLAAHKDLTGAATHVIHIAGMWGKAEGHAFYSLAKSGDETSEMILAKSLMFDENNQLKGFMPGLFSGSVSNDYLNQPLGVVNTDYVRLNFRNQYSQNVCYINTTADWRA